MKAAQILTLVLMISPGMVLAEVGDVHTVKTENAVIYEGPDKSTGEAGKLPKGAEIMEMDTDGEWYEIYSTDTDLGGWILKSDTEVLGGGDSQTVAEKATVEAATPEKSTAGKKAAATDTTSTAISLKSSGEKSLGLQKFEQYLQKYNIRTKEVKGYVPFTSAENLGNGELKLTVTNRWLDNSRARRTTSLITIYSRWKRANGLPNVTVVAVDLSGNKVIQYPRSIR